MVSHINNIFSPKFLRDVELNIIHRNSKIRKVNIFAVIRIVNPWVFRENTRHSFSKEYFQIEKVDHRNLYILRNCGYHSSLIAFSGWKSLITESHVLNSHFPIEFVNILNVQNSIISAVSACGVDSIESDIRFLNVVAIFHHVEI